MSAGRYLLALDQGTSSSRAGLVDDTGRMVAVASAPFATTYPADGWVEQDPEAIWSSQLAAAREVLAGQGLDAGAVRAIGITNQRETTLLWRRSDGRPVHEALVWQDRRTAGRCSELRRAGLEDELQRRSGLVPDPYFSATKLEWLLREVPAAREEAARGELAFGTVDSFLLWRLTGGAGRPGLHATDVSNASRTLLWNLAEERWDPYLLELFGVPATVLPEVRSSAGEFGVAHPEWFGRAIPITGIAGDQQAALFGQACFQPGMAKNTYGTGCFLLLNTGARPAACGGGLLATAAWRTPAGSRFALEGSVFSAGSAIQWLRDGMEIIASAAESEELARTVPDTGGVFFVPAFTGLGAPYWDPTARGAIVGLTRSTTRAHLARAALEAIALQTVELVEAMRAGAGAALPELRVDGGAAANNLLLQLQADLLGLPVARAAVRETTALGAAWLAGLGAGHWKDEAEVGSLWGCDRVFTPELDEAARAERIAAWRRAVERARGWTQVG